MPANFLQILPDPLHPITDAGFESSGGDVGQGFFSVSVTEMHPTQIDRSISGIFTQRSANQSKWMFNLNYNPLTKEQFAPIYNFIMQKQGSRKSFYVSLPQYLKPKDPLFATHVLSNTMTTSESKAAGATSIQIGSWPGNDYSVKGLPMFGDMFTIEDAADSLHTKAYMVTHVETATNYKDAPTSASVRIHFSPSLQKYTNSGAEVVFNSPLIKVTMASDVQEYALDADNLYEFSLKLQEEFY